jgi:TatD family-associated radical SAM protein
MAMLTAVREARRGIAYTLGGGGWELQTLYLALTNATKCRALIDTRGPGFTMPDSSGYAPLEGDEPTVDELVAVIDRSFDLRPLQRDMDDIEVVFGGYGDSLLRVQLLCETVERVRADRHGTSFRAMTSGLFADAATVLDPLDAAGVKRVTVALNAANPQQYKDVMAPSDPTLGFSDVCSFVVAAAERGMQVSCTAVENGVVDTKKVRKLAMALGASEFRVRTFVP